MHKFPRITLLFLPVLFVSCNLAVAPAAPSPTRSPTEALTPTVTPTLTETPTPSPTPRPTADRVVIISIDGLRPDGLLQANIPRISELINGGSATFTARTILPSATLPAHASMVSGRCVSKHGILWNDLIPSEEPLQGATVFSIAKDAGMRTVMVVGKEKLITLARPGTVDTFRYVNGSDEDIVQKALQEASGGFGVLFVHLILPDFYGHLTGWMSPEYIRGIGRDDAAVGTLLDGLRAGGLLDRAIVILTADHGGHGLTHGTYQKEDMTIPWIIYGFGVSEGVPIDVPVSIMDTAATAVWGLGLGIPADWDGRPVVEAFGLQADLLPVATASATRCGI
ncbi:MAG: alkaline phosphatase family protein [Anaerolineales bacterium]|nr:alkaline phosphatase family protein [Anaerolineales bacterium]